MQCIKCCRELQDNHVFCAHCLSVMEQKPVKPGTPVVIPKRPQKVYAPVVKKEKPEDQIPKLQKTIRALIWTCLCLAVALAVSIGILAYHFAANDHNAPAIGQNYSTEAPDDAPLSR